MENFTDNDVKEFTDKLRNALNKVTGYQISESEVNDNKSNWRIITMDELFDYINKDFKEQNVFLKPNFPSRRWGHTFTKTSTTHIKQINSLLEKLKADGYQVRKRIEKQNNLGKFYQIQIKNHPDRIA